MHLATKSKRAADELERLVVELLRLDEHLLAHADLAEVVEEARVLELAQILAREVRVLVRTVRLAVDDLRELDREIGDAARVTARRRIARLDRFDARLHEALEEPPDLVVEHRVLERDARLRGDHPEELFAALVERDDLLVHVACA